MATCPTVATNEKASDVSTLRNDSPPSGPTHGKSTASGTSRIGPQSSHLSQRADAAHVEKSEDVEEDSSPSGKAPRADGRIEIDEAYNYDKLGFAFPT